jgi:hypothetical protein
MEIKAGDRVRVRVGFERAGREGTVSLAYHQGPEMRNVFVHLDGDPADTRFSEKELEVIMASIPWAAAA